MTEKKVKKSIGEICSDFAAKFIGSWVFLNIYNGFVSLWIFGNSMAGHAAIDPPPFIGLNLVLSWMAGVQAPLIMMAQNRQEARDRAKEAKREQEEDERAKYQLHVAEATLEIVRNLKHFKDDMAVIKSEMADIRKEISQVRRA